MRRPESAQKVDFALDVFVDVAFPVLFACLPSDASSNIDRHGITETNHLQINNNNELTTGAFDWTPTDKDMCIVFILFSWFW